MFQHAYSLSSSTLWWSSSSSSKKIHDNVVARDFHLAPPPNPVSSLHSIFVAFILEAFFIEYMVEKSELQTALEKKIEELNLCVEQ